jgi:hypothetical protein
MNPAWEELVRRLSASYSRIINGKGLMRVVLLLLAATLGSGVAIFAATTAPHSQEYSAYADPKKPVISYLLSDPQNVAEFQQVFFLSEVELGAILAVIQEENEILSWEYVESESIVESSEGLPAAEVRQGIAASDYDEQVKQAVARTKAAIEAMLPKYLRPRLHAWVDTKWQQEVQQYNAESTATLQAASVQAASSGGKRFRVFATQYRGHTRYEVALPHRKLKSRGGFRVRIYRGGHRIRAPIKEVGPWNLHDNYWDRRRDMWKDLPRGLPEAQAAYYNNYNRGRDEFGRKVLNPAGVDLTPRAARKLGLRKYQNAWVYISMPRTRR